MSDVGIEELDQESEKPLVLFAASNPQVVMSTELDTAHTIDRFVYSNDTKKASVVEDANFATGSKILRGRRHSIFKDTFHTNTVSCPRSYVRIASMK